MEPTRCDHPACGKWTYTDYCDDHKPTVPAIGTVRGIPAVSALTVRVSPRWTQTPQTAEQYNRSPRKSRKGTAQRTQPTLSARAADNADRAAAAAARTAALMQAHAIGNDGEAG
jgi:hypothetical protein